MHESVSMWSIERNVRKDGFSQTDFVEWANDQQLKYVELLSYFMEGDNLSNIVKRLKKYSISVSCYTVVTNFVTPESGDWKKLEQEIQEAIAVGAEFIRVTAGEGKLPPEVAFQAIVTNLKRACDLVSNTNITLVLENVGSYSCHSDDVMAIINAVDSPRLKVNFDVANALLADEDPVSAFENMNDAIAYVHFKDFQHFDSSKPGFVEPDDQWKIQSSFAGKKYLGCALGDGLIPLDRFINYLSEQKYKGIISVEYEGVEGIAETEKSLHYLRSLL